MEKFYSKKTLSWSFVISVLINALIFFFCIKLLNVVYSIKKPLEVVLLVSNDIEKSYTNWRLPKEVVQKKINRKVLPTIPNNNLILEVSQKSIREKQLQPQIKSTNEIKTQNNNQLDIAQNASKDTLNQLRQANTATLKQNLQKENKSENIIQTQNATQSISKEDYTVLRKLIEKHLRYPYLARRNGYEGTVVLSFILQDSSFKDINIVKSSGYSILDKSAIDAIKKIEPLVNINKNVKIVIPINFRLSNS
ncbi:Ferric siderophore transport system, periplasmic binding protein TonB [Desulfurella amilsii]|uniref:Ferric siderophore transport system, periplasmic binding protein TonB n=1 Tax=Desulfurella amilsii TaxID=1562698 RepID=A0A1X4XVB5_9BACT|nr:energy transducer TonB [Desulfurella amilsii]OSS41477.1 Ferric siderophore transport system, periplasmic binding protein TonB [Desulfurella amilsii]